MSSVATVVMGACMVERHITLDRSVFGSDQAASVEPQGVSRLVSYIRAVEASLGDGVKSVWPSEVPIMEKLRRVDWAVCRLWSCHRKTACIFTSGRLGVDRV